MEKKVKRLFERRQEVMLWETDTFMIIDKKKGFPLMRTIDEYIDKRVGDNIEVLKWVLSLIDEPGNTSGDVKHAINEKIFTFTEKKDEVIKT